MLVFLVTVIVVAGLLALDRLYPASREPDKYTNLDWEIIRTGYGYDAQFYGHIYSVVKNKIKTVYNTRNFNQRDDAEKFTKKIYRTMRTEYGLVEELENSSIYTNRNFLSQRR